MEALGMAPRPLFDVSTQGACMLGKATPFFPGLDPFAWGGTASVQCKWSICSVSSLDSSDCKGLCVCCLCLCRDRVFTLLIRPVVLLWSCGKSDNLSVHVCPYQSADVIIELSPQEETDSIWFSVPFLILQFVCLCAQCVGLHTYSSSRLFSFWMTSDEWFSFLS